MFFTYLLLFVLAVILLLLIKDRQAFFKLREELENSNEEKQILVDFLHVVAEDIARGADKNAIYKRLVRATAFSCGAMSACVFEKSGSKLVPVASEGLFPPLARTVPPQSKYATRTDFLENAIKSDALDIDSSVVGEVFKTGVPVFIRKADGDPRLPRHKDDSLKIKSFIAVPVMFLGVVYGVLVVVNSISEKSFSKTVFSLARSLGEHGGLAMYNLDGIQARLTKSKMESDLRLASSVQHYLLPESLPENKYFATAVKYFPHQLIGGDFYDIIPLPDGKTGVVIADVSGKGVSAAILMALAQSKLQYIAKLGLSPAQTLKKLNAEIVHSMRTDMFITITFAVINADATSITVARAGHELPIIYKAAERKCVEVKSQGMAVGMVDPEIFDGSINDVSVGFEANDILVLYTDGLTEASNAAGEEYSAMRLIKTIEKLAPNDVLSFNDKIIRTLEEFTDSKSYDDDLTLLSIKKF